MTNEEAIKKIVELLEYKAYNYTVLTDEVIKKIDNKALYKAIEALKKADMREEVDNTLTVDFEKECMKHYKQGRKDERAILNGELFQSCSELDMKEAEE